MSGVGGVGNDPVPSFFPGGEPEILQLNNLEEEPPVIVDPEPDFLTLTTDPQAIPLPEGVISINEWIEMITEAINRLRAELNEAEFLDAEKAIEFQLSAAEEMDTVLAEYRSIINLVRAWNILLGSESSLVILNQINSNLLMINSLLQTIANSDVIRAQNANQAASIFDDPVALQDYITNQFGGDEVAARNQLFQDIQDYNIWLNTRSVLLANVSVTLQEVSDAIDLYNFQIGGIDDALAQVNQEREEFDLPPIIFTGMIDPLPQISTDILDYLAYEGTLEPIPIEVPAIPDANVNLHAVFTDPPLTLDTERLELIIGALEAQAINAGTDPNLAGQAFLIAAQNLASYATEADFLLAVRDAYETLLPGQGIQQFELAVLDIPARIIAIPLPVNPTVRLVSYKQAFSVDAREALRDALENAGGSAVQVNNAIEAAEMNGPYATTGEFYAAVKAAYIIENPTTGEAIFDQAILNVPLLVGVPVPDPSMDLTLLPPFPRPTFPQAPISEALDALWRSGADSTLVAINSLTGFVELAEAFFDAEKELYTVFGIDILLFAPTVDRISRAFVENISTIGGGVALSGFSLGLQSRVLEIALSTATLRALSTIYRNPIPGREFARLQFTALELMYRSSLLSSLPAARFLVTRLGSLSAVSSGDAVAIAEALIIQLGGIVSSGLLRTVVNANFNRRSRRLGFASIGELASFTRSVSSALSLSILSVALSQLGRRIGLPNLVAQVFGQASGLPTSDLLVALTARARFLDVLDNPITLFSLKKALTDRLSLRGLSPAFAAQLVNNALNSVVLQGGYQTFSSLRASLRQQFQLAGFNFFRANQLANETLALISGDVGVRFLNVAFGVNFDPSVMAASIVNNIYGLDLGLAQSILSNAVVRSLSFGGYGSRVRLQNELREQFQNLGLNRQEAYSVARTTADFMETIGVLVPFNRYPDVINLLLGETPMRAITFGYGLRRQELVEDLEIRGLPNTQAELIADQFLALQSGSFIRPENLFEQAFNAAIQRSLASNPGTQRDFRDALVGELRAVGFDRSSANFLANSAVIFGSEGRVPSLFGGSEQRHFALVGALSSELQSTQNISQNQATSIVGTASANAFLSGGPFATEDLFHELLREEISRELIGNFGVYDGNFIFDRALASLAPANALLSLEALASELGKRVVGVVRPDLGSQLAEELKDRILTTVLGAATVDEIADEEKRNPLSVLSQVDTHVDRLLSQEAREDRDRLSRNLSRMLEAFLKPNAEVGFVLQSLMDHPSTFIGSLLVEKPKGEILDIPV